MDEIDAKTASFFPSYPTESFFKKGQNISLDIERTGSKSPQSIANPDTFAISACQRDLRCWGERHLVSASFAYQDYVEKLTKYDFEWLDGWLDSKFSHYRWRDKTKGIVTYIGDKIKFQNGFGAW